MGQEIARSGFSDEDRERYRSRLRAETSTLKRWFSERRFAEDEGYTAGLELEAWLIDRNCLPTPHSDEFISTTNDPRVVHELSKFNFELNADPRPLAGDCFSATRADVETLWQRCRRAGDTLDMRMLMIGILPTVRDEMLQPAWMAEVNRYRALNEEIMHARRDQPLHIAIHGEDELDLTCGHIMLEAACTSLQAHLKIDQDEAPRLYNAAQIAAAPLVAATANSPFLYGKTLWEETRIPTFEQATQILGFPDRTGRRVLRVTLGTGYIRHSLLELFLENLSYPPLLPIIDGEPDQMPCLKLQNGTIWRWNRPIIGFDPDGTPHLRIEQRVMPSGPTIEDVVANLALSHGMTLALGRAETPPESETPFEDCRANFYACARDGLDAELRFAGRGATARALLLDRLLPAAREALADEGVDDAELDHVFDGILVPRIESGQTGSQWQRAWYRDHGRNFQALTERYLELQEQGEPVHRWPL